MCSSHAVRRTIVLVLVLFSTIEDPDPGTPSSPSSGWNNSLHPMLGLFLTAELQGNFLGTNERLTPAVTDLRPVDETDNPFVYMFQVQCTSCRETHSKYVGFTRFEKRDMSRGRGDANFVWKCSSCKRESSASIVSKEIPSYNAESSRISRKLFDMDCRGLEFIDFKSQGEWTCKGETSGTRFAEIDLSDGEWYEYDEKAGQEVSITDVRFEIRRS